jgi:hypothetical protein
MNVRPLAGLLLLACASASNAQRRFYFDYREFAGPADIPRQLIIEGSDAILLRSRCEPESEGQPIGSFRGRVAQTDVARLERELPTSLNIAGPLMPDSAYFAFELRSSARNVTLRVPRHPAAIAQIRPVAGIVDAIDKDISKHPYRVLKLDLRLVHGASAGNALQLRLENPGVKPSSVLISKDTIAVETLPIAISGPSTAGPLVWRRTAVDIDRAASLVIGAGGSVTVPCPFALPLEGPVFARVRFLHRGPVGVDVAEISGSALSNRVRIGVNTAK